VPERVDLFAGSAAAHPDDDGPVLDRVGHVPDPSQRSHREGRDAFDRSSVRVVADRRPVALVAGVKQPTQVLVGLGRPPGPEDGVGLVDQECRRVVAADGPPKARAAPPRRVPGVGALVAVGRVVVQPTRRVWASTKTQ
jgi:hypothetical protein